ncbi:MAG: transposase, partial [Cyanobacteriota bacterium]
SHPKSATLVKRRDGSYYIQVCLESKPPEPQGGDKVLGVDLGRTDIAHTQCSAPLTRTEGQHWNGKDITKVRDHFADLRAKLQHKASKGTRSSRRRCRQLLQQLSGRERRFQSWVNHNVSKRIVEAAEALSASIALEDLTGIRERTNQQPRNKTERRRSNSWAFHQLRLFIVLRTTRRVIGYKALRSGVRVVFVDPRYTSQTCHCCLHIHPDPGQSYRSGKQFQCGHCGWHGDADFNGAKNIRAPHRWRDQAIGALVNRPGGSWLFCQITGGLLKARALPARVFA